MPISGSNGKESKGDAVIGPILKDFVTSCSRLNLKYLQMGPQALIERKF